MAKVHGVEVVHSGPTADIQRAIQERSKRRAKQLAEMFDTQDINWDIERVDGASVQDVAAGYQRDAENRAVRGDWK